MPYTLCSLLKTLQLANHGSKENFKNWTRPLNRTVLLTKINKNALFIIKPDNLVRLYEERIPLQTYPFNGF